MRRSIQIGLILSVAICSAIVSSASAKPQRASAEPQEAIAPPKPVLRCVYDALCAFNMYTTFLVDYTDDGTYGTPLRYTYQYSADGNTWKTLLASHSYPIYTHYTYMFYEGWYRVYVGNPSCIDDLNQCTVSDPLFMPVAETCTRLVPDPIEEDDNPYVCKQGTLLFREDFGGNEPSDPMLCTTPLATMDNSTYHIQNTLETSGSSGKYWLTKVGWLNGNRKSTSYYPYEYCDMYAQWHVQDDHTYFEDFSRGYFLEVDGKGGKSPFYSTEIEVCHELDLSFSAYVANVMTANQDKNLNAVKPKVRFAVVNAETNDLIGEASSGPIQADQRWLGQTRAEMYHSAKWNLVGMHFTVPEGVERVKLTIYNDASGGSGNDFAMDDIEIRLCTPTVTVTSEREATLGSDYTLTAFVTDDSSFPEPFEYRWQHSADSLTWETTTFCSLHRDSTIHGVQESDAGWWRLMVAGHGNIDHPNCRAVSQPFKLKVINPVTVNDFCQEGVTVFMEDFGGNEVSDPQISANAVQGMSSSYTQMSSAQTSISPRTYLVTKSGFCFGDTIGWREAVTDAEKEQLSSIWFIQDDHTYPDDYSRGYFLEVDGAKDQERLYQSQPFEVCEGAKLSFYAYVANVMTPTQYETLRAIGQKPYVPTLRIVLRNTANNAIVAQLLSDPISPDENLSGVQDWIHSSRWQPIGASYTVPAEISQVQLEIYNENNQSTLGNDFAIDDIQVRLCLPTGTIVSPEEVCKDSVYRFDVAINDNTLLPITPAYQWYYSTDNNSWTALSGADSLPLTFAQTKFSDAGWYKLMLAEQGHLDDASCRSESEPFQLEVKDCRPLPPLAQPQIVSEHIVCKDSAYCFEVQFTNAAALPDTVVYTYEWEYSRNSRKWGHYADGLNLCLPAVTEEEVGWYRLKSRFVYPVLEGESVSGSFRLDITECVPEEPKEPEQPEEPEEPEEPEQPEEPSEPTNPENPEEPSEPQEPEEQSESEQPQEPSDPENPEQPEQPEEPEQPSEETLYELIVNKYNWVILCDNVRLAEYFPERTAVTYTWYKNGSIIEGATEDDYSESQELKGIFQLHLTLDNNQLVKSNVLYINTTVPTETRVACYNDVGLLLFETTAPPDLSGLGSGFYILLYQSENGTRAEKVYIP